MGWEVKIALDGQSKYGLAESSAKTRKFFTGGSQEQKRTGPKFIMLSSFNRFEWIFAKMVKYENEG